MSFLIFDKIEVSPDPLLSDCRILNRQISESEAGLWDRSFNHAIIWSPFVEVSIPEKAKRLKDLEKVGIRLLHCSTSSMVKW